MWNTDCNNDKEKDYKNALWEDYKKLRDELFVLEQSSPVKSVTPDLLDIIDCIKKFDSSESLEVKGRYFEIIQQDLRRVPVQSVEGSAEDFLRDEMDLRHEKKSGVNSFDDWCNTDITFGLRTIAEWLKEYAQSKQTAMPTDEEYEPYFGWCDVKGCDNEGCSGGIAWRNTGYWTVCSKHSAMERSGEPQPLMKQTAIGREASRDKETGYLPPDSKLTPQYE